MRIVKIIPFENGGHANQTGNFSSVPPGWAIIPGDLETPNFPFGEIIVEKINGLSVVTSWTPREMPEPEPIPEPEPETSVWDELDAAYQEGVDSV